MPAQTSSSSNPRSRALGRERVAVIGPARQARRSPAISPARDATCDVGTRIPRAARRESVSLTGSYAVHGAALVLSLVSAAGAREVVSEAAAAIRPGAVFADLNTGSAALKHEFAAAIEAAGAQFADVAVMAPVPGRGLRVPLLASGAGERDSPSSSGRSVRRSSCCRAAREPPQHGSSFARCS